MNDYREPWAIRDGLIFSRDGHAAEAIAAQNPVCERLIACLNALAGIPTEELLAITETDDDSDLKTYMRQLIRIAIGAEAEKVKRRVFDMRQGT